MTSSTDKLNENNVVKFPGGDEAMEQASLWLVRLERGLRPDELEQFRILMQANPAVARALEELATFWGERQLVEEFLIQGSPAAQFPRKKSLFSWRGMAAAMVVLAAGFAIYTYTDLKAREEAAEALARFEAHYSTKIGEQATRQLPDGSIITLNTGTEVHVHFQGKDRLIDLVRGEAYFSVAHDVERPFGVRAGGRIVQAVGTAFNVKIQEEGESAGKIEVAVTDGIVRILDEETIPSEAPDADTADAWWNKPAMANNVVMGQLALIGNPASPVGPVPEIRLLQPAEMDTRMAWQRGELIFEGQPLREVLQEYSRYTTTQFLLENDALGDIRVGGYFRVGDVDGLLVTLAENFQIDAERRAGNRVLLR